MSKVSKKKRKSTKKGKMPDLEVTRKAKGIIKDLESAESQGDMLRIHRKLVKQEGVGNRMADRIIERGIKMLEGERNKG